MLHFPAVPKDVELVQPLTDVLLLVPVDLPDQVLLTNQLLPLSLKQFLSIKSILKIHSSSSLQHYGRAFSQEKLNSGQAFLGLNRGKIGAKSGKRVIKSSKIGAKSGQNNHYC